jgi:uncharacterized protein DUF6378
MWTGLLRDKLQEGKLITTKDVPIMMACLKLSRLMNKIKRDSITDVCGYMGRLMMVLEDEDDLLL